MVEKYMSRRDHRCSVGYASNLWVLVVFSLVRRSDSQAASFEGLPYIAHKSWASEKVGAVPVPPLATAIADVPFGGLSSAWPPTPPPPPIPPPPIPPPPAAPGISAYKNGATSYTGSPVLGDGTANKMSSFYGAGALGNAATERFKELNVSFGENGTDIQKLGHMVKDVTESIAARGGGKNASLSSLDETQSGSRDWPTRLRGAAMRFVEATQGRGKVQQKYSPGERNLQFTYFDPKDAPPWMAPPWTAGGTPPSLQGVQSQAMQPVVGTPLAAAPFSARAPVF